MTLLRTIQSESVELNSAVRRAVTIVQADQLRPAEPGPSAIPPADRKAMFGVHLIPQPSPQAEYCKITSTINDIHVLHALFVFSGILIAMNSQTVHQL